MISDISGPHPRVVALLKLLADEIYYLVEKRPGTARGVENQDARGCFLFLALYPVLIAFFDGVFYCRGIGETRR